nr:hypothetical protein HmN_000211400 [Hymenolepis microstoma]
MQYHRPTPSPSSVRFNPQLVPLMNPIRHYTETPTPSSPILEDLKMGGQSIMIEGGLLEFCLPPPRQFQLMPVRPVSSQLQPYWGANGSIVFVHWLTKTFYTPEQVSELFGSKLQSPMDTTFRVPNQPPPWQFGMPPRPNAGVPSIQHLLTQFRNLRPSISIWPAPPQARWPPP